VDPDSIGDQVPRHTANWLDQLVEAGHLTPDQRIALAVEDGATTLSGLLRRVELAGHGPKQVLTDAVTRRSLDDARQITSVLHSRISDRVSLDPTGDTFAAWTPTVDDPQWQDYLATLARIADERRSDLGRKAAIEGPVWAVEALCARRRLIARRSGPHGRSAPHRLPATAS
jgi:hypothetical protein